MTVLDNASNDKMFIPPGGVALGTTSPAEVCQLMHDPTQPNLTGTTNGNRTLFQATTLDFIIRSNESWDNVQTRVVTFIQ